MPKRKRKESEKKPGKHHGKTQHHGKLHPCDEPDLSSILKIPGTGQEEPDEFDLPLHSTAVSDLEEEDEGKDRCSGPNGSIHKSFDSEPGKNNRVKRKIRNGLNSEMERKNSKEEAVKENTKSKEPNVEDFRVPSAPPLRSGSSECKTSDRISDTIKTWNTDKMPRKRANSAVQQKEGSSTEGSSNSDSEDVNPSLRKVWGPQGMKKVASHITQAEVILDELEKIASTYKQGVELKICRKAIDRFYIGFRDQLTSAITDTEELKRTKLKNAKMVRATNKKRQKLIEVKEELIRTEPQLKKLQREYAELKGRQSSLRNAVQFMTDLKDLQQKYASDRKKNPQDKIRYGVSSVPALLVESRTILGVENDFQNMESKLQQMFDLQEKK